MAGKNVAHPLHLCPGIFLSLLYNNRQTAQAYRDTGIYEKEVLPVSQNSISLGLAQLALKNFKSPKEGSLDSDVSHLKACDREGLGASTPFYWPSYGAELQGRLRDDYYGLLADWNKLLVSVVGIYTLTYNRQLIADQLLSLIEVDENFTGYDDPVQGRFIPRDELLEERPDILFQTFTLGIWVWICRQQPSNKIDVKAMKNWHTFMFKHQAYVRVLTEEEIKKSASLHADAEIETVETVQRPAAAEEGPELRFDGYLSGETAMTAITVDQLPTDYAEYMRRAREKHGTVKTFLCPAVPIPFYYCYECNSLRWHTTGKSVENPIIGVDYDYMHEPNIVALLHTRHPVLLTGAAGLGKSMMLRHLLLTGIGHYPRLRKIPVLVPLRDATENSGSMEELVFSEMRQLCPSLEPARFHADLAAGRFLFLLDGLDEVNSALRVTMEQKLEHFTNLWAGNTFIVSSRPDSNFMRLHGYTVLELEPFNERQAIAFVNKANFCPDAPEIKQKFLELLRGGLTETHSAFTGNPLLLSIMLLTYGKYKEIPSQMHEFYDRAYNVLAEQHDESKDGFRREWKTGLTPEDFADVFAEFCARTYDAEQYIFTRAEMERYFLSLNSVKRCGMKFTARDFIDDLTNGVCLMMADNDRYLFIHRSFQEYFCARYFARAAEQKLAGFGRHLEERFAAASSKNDITLQMLYGMVPREVEKSILLTLLESLTDECDGENGYRTFLQRIYPSVEYYVGEVPDWTGPNVGNSFLYRFIVNDLKVCPEVQLTLPAVAEFQWLAFYAIKRHYGGRFLMADDGHGNDRETGKPVKIIGRTYAFRVKDVFDEKDKYPELITALCAADCPLRVEYDCVRAYTRQLQEKYSRQRNRLTYDLFE